MYRHFSTTKLILILPFITLAGCAEDFPVTTAAKSWDAIGGSKADAVVELSYEYNYNESPKINEGSAFKEAKYRCGNWGYSSSTPFDPSTECVAYQGMECNTWKVVQKFQCA